MKPGDRVAYAKHFLKCIFAGPTDEMWHRRGTIVSTEGNIAKVLWDGDHEPVSVLTTNLAHPGPNIRFCG